MTVPTWLSRKQNGSAATEGRQNFVPCHGAVACPNAQIQAWLARLGIMDLSSVERAEDDVPDGVIQMLARKTSSNDPSTSSGDSGTEKCSALRSALGADNVSTHALLLLYLLPAVNESNVDPSMVQAVEALSEVHECLSTPAASTAEPFSKDTLAVIYSTVAAIRFGGP